MTKQDVIADLPEAVPKKRKQIEQLLDIHIAMWLDGDNIIPSERRRLEEEKDRRKKLVPDNKIGILVGVEGVTPKQFEALEDILPQLKPTEIHWTSDNISQRVAEIVYGLSLEHVVTHAEIKEIIQSVSSVIAFPKETREPIKKEAPVWEGIKYARHRKVPVTVVFPDGQTATRVNCE